MGIPVESATFVVADRLNTGDAIGFIALLALASWGYRDIKKDIKDVKKDIKKDIKDLSDKFEDLSDKFGMQQQLNTYASSRAPPPWALTSSRSHSLCELSLAHSPTPRSSDHRPLLTFLPRAPKQSGEYARRPLHVYLHVDLRDLRGGDGSDKASWSEPRPPRSRPRPPRSRQQLQPGASTTSLPLSPAAPLRGTLPVQRGSVGRSPPPTHRR